MGRISEEIIDKIIQNSDIIDVVSEFVPLKKAGRGYMGVCPFHGDKGPSLSVSHEKQLYHCFGCGASGNVIGFIMKIKNLEYIDAIKYLGERAGITITEENNNAIKSKSGQLKEKLYEINITAARYYFLCLSKNKEAYSYLKERGIEDSTIKKFGLGYSPNSWSSIINFLKSKGFKEEEIRQSGLISEKGKDIYDKFRHRIMYPVFDIKGRVIGFGGRVMDNSKPKYLNSPETPVFIKGTNLYGFNYAIKEKAASGIIIVEGYMDLISLFQHGIKNAAASLGTSLTNDQAKLIRRYFSDVYICYDADKAGQTAAIRGMDILKAAGCNVKVLQVPSGKDPDEFLRSHGSDEFLKLLDEGLPIIQYRLKMVREGMNLNDPEQRSRFIMEASQILKESANEIEIQAYAAQIYNQTGIDTKFILEQVNRLKVDKKIKENTNEIFRNNIVGTDAAKEPVYIKAERLLLKYAAESKEYFYYIKERISEEDIITPVYKKVFNIIDNSYGCNEATDVLSLLRKFEIQDEITLVSSIFTEELIVKPDYRIIDDLIKKIKTCNLEQSINDIKLEIYKYEKMNDIDKTTELVKRLMNYQKQLSSL